MHLDLVTKTAVDAVHVCLGDRQPNNAFDCNNGILQKVSGNLDQTLVLAPGEWRYNLRLVAGADVAYTTTIVAS